jgi:mannose-6-phosphate isomerase
LKGLLVEGAIEQLAEDKRHADLIKRGSGCGARDRPCYSPVLAMPPFLHPIFCTPNEASHEQSRSALFLSMQNPIQGYDWGSHDALTTLFGIPNPAGKPQAELWMGAHPNGCSGSAGRAGAEALDPDRERPRRRAGQATQTRFGSLPFLFKVLCAEKALSIQVHPSKAQAEAGFAKKSRRHLAQGSQSQLQGSQPQARAGVCPHPYQAMNGFRAIPAILALFEQVKLPPLPSWSPPSPPARTKRVCALLPPAAGAGRGAQGGTGGALAMPPPIRMKRPCPDHQPGRPVPGMWAVLAALAERGDPAAGQAMYLDACTPHAYVRGLASDHGQLRQRAARRAHSQVHRRGRAVGLHPLPAQAGRPDPAGPRMEGAVQHFEVPVPTSPSASTRRASTSSPPPAPRSCLPSTRP